MDKDSQIERRRAAIRFAINSCRLEGLTIEESMEIHFERYILGEITSDELIQAGLARYDKTPKE